MQRVKAATVTRWWFALSALLLFGLGAWARAVELREVEPPALLTNLFELRHSAEQRPMVQHPFLIVADVLDADVTNNVLVLRDSSGTEFIQLDLGGRTFEPGATVRLEGRGYGVVPKGFGLALVSRLAVDNDGVHAMTVESGGVFLHAGVNPLNVQYFNHLGDFGLRVEYEGPHLPRQSIPSSVLSRAQVESSVGTTNFSTGLDYRCYEGIWGHLPTFAGHHPLKLGFAANFDLDVRTRKEDVGLEFNGFITIPRDGLYTFHLTSDDGSRLLVGESSLDLRLLSQGCPPRAAENVPVVGPERNNRPWVTLEGTVSFAGLGEAAGEMAMRVGNYDIRVEVFDGSECAPAFPLDSRIRVSGIYRDVITDDGSSGPGMLLVAGWNAIHPEPAHLATATNHVEATSLAGRELPPAPHAPHNFATIAEVKAISSELAKQQLPVSVRGVITAVLPSSISAAVVQDSTKGICIFLQELKEPVSLKRGEFYQIDGVSGPGDFAPVIMARRITYLGTGRLPPPVRATWDRMMNGSLDTQYAEIEGVVSAVEGQKLVMLTEGGKITLDLSQFQQEELAALEGAVVRVRGCFFAGFNVQTRALETGFLTVMGGALAILQAAPRDPFEVPAKSIGELLLYDSKAAPFRRLKIGGQVVYGRQGEYFLTDGANGLRVSPKSSARFASGDLVEASGFLEFGGPVVELKEAILRKTGRAALAAPTRLAPEQLLLGHHTGTRVQLEATLMNQWLERSGYVLELQSGFRAFKAQLDSRGQSVSLPPIGSRLELTGVYVAQGNRAADGTVSGFELLLNSPAAIRILATPPWWTLKRVLAVAGILAVLLLAALVWNKQLHWKVEERGRQLESEIRSRQQAESRQAAEAERSRIARDLHDELGSGLTEVSLLAGAGFGELGGVENNHDRFRVIAEKARALVSGLDVIVWAIDPKRNSLQSFADYLCRYATELFSASKIACRFQIPIQCNAIALSEAARHSLFLAVKEALNNVIRHSSATEVELQVSQSGDRLEVVVVDNGCGFDRNTILRGNGLTNLSERLEALNGQCHIESQVGRGTTVKFVIPLPHESS